jgi:hypothetical protein
VACREIRLCSPLCPSQHAGKLLQSLNWPNMYPISRRRRRYSQPEYQYPTVPEARS